LVLVFLQVNLLYPFLIKEMDKIKIEKLDAPKKTLKSILKKPTKLKLKRVRDPATTKHTMKILTNKGHHRKDKTLKKRIKKLSDEKVSKILEGSGLVKNKDMPPDIQRQILVNATGAGFVSI
jgi:hypothetical protein